MKKAILAIVVILSGCATAPEQPVVAAYRDSMQRISNVYAQQAVIEGLTGTPSTSLVWTGTGEYK